MTDRVPLPAGRTYIDGQMVRQLRNHRGWSLETLGRMANLSWLSVQRLETGRQRYGAVPSRSPVVVVKTETLDRIAAAFDIPAAVLRGTPPGGKEAAA